MGFSLAEVLRIAATVAGTAVAGPFGGIGAAALTGLANEIDKEDDPETPKAVREMKRKRRKRWVEYAEDREKKKRKHLSKIEGDTTQLKRVLSAQAAADLRAIIAADLHDTEERFADEQEINLYAEAASAAARGKL